MRTTFRDAPMGAVLVIVEEGSPIIGRKAMIDGEPALEWNTLVSDEAGNPDKFVAYAFVRPEAPVFVLTTSLDEIVDELDDFSDDIGEPPEGFCVAH